MNFEQMCHHNVYAVVTFLNKVFYLFYRKFWACNIIFFPIISIWIFLTIDIVLVKYTVFNAFSHEFPKKKAFLN